MASQKQEAVREAYKDWIFQDADRREALCEKYNEIFNSNRPREFDGSHLTFPGMSPDITLRPHQKMRLPISFTGIILCLHIVWGLENL